MRRIRVGMAKKSNKKSKTTKDAELLELPEGRPQPDEANPGGTEGADAAWRGGASNVGEVINPPERGVDTTYSLGDRDDIPRVESVSAHFCEKCGQGFDTEEMLNVHRRTAHHQHG
jgi:hypothetical protein